MILYLLFGFILLVILFFIFIRLKYRFWALQPVFHFYDLYYWFINVGIIRKELPEKNKYVNLKQITTKTFDDLDKLTKMKILILIQQNYWVNGENKYAPKLDNIEPYFIGHSYKCFWSYYLEDELYIDNKTNKTIIEKRIIGVITSRPLHIKIGTNKFDAYYVDYLCVNKSKRKMNIAPQLIQTHEYIQSHQNKHISVSLFKREEELTGIIPLTIYKTYCFDMTKMVIDNNSKSNLKINLLTADRQNCYYLYNCLNQSNKKWDIMIYPVISNLIELIASKNIYTKMLLVDNEIDTVFVFKKSCIFIQEGKEVLSCIASIRGELTNEEFVSYFKIALQSILKEDNNFTYLSIEDISDNKILINDVCLNVFPTTISPMAYFFYNFAYNPFQSDKCFIIN